MPEPLKNMYNPRFFKAFIKTVREVVPKFDEQKFIKQVFDDTWEAKELKQRIRHTSTILKEHLPGNYKKQVDLIIRIINQLEANGTKGGFEYIFFPDFIEQYGLDDLETSLTAIEKITQFISCEFAIRPFLLKFPGSNDANAQMEQTSPPPCAPFFK